MAKQILKTKKKKKWFALYSPQIFNSQLIGESNLEDSSKLQGKHINASLSQITGDMRKQNINVALRVNKVIDGKGHTELIGMKIVQGFVKRLTRRGRTKIDDSFTVKSKEGVLVRIKPMIFTINNCPRTTATDIRVKAKELFTEVVSSQGFLTTIQQILTMRLQKGIKEKLNKIFPIKSVDVRLIEREIIRGRVPEANLLEPEKLGSDNKPKFQQKPVEDKKEEEKSETETKKEEEKQVEKEEKADVEKKVEEKKSDEKTE